MSAVTDSGRDTRFASASPGVKNLLSLYAVLTGEKMTDIETKFDGQGYGNAEKSALG